MKSNNKKQSNKTLITAIDWSGSKEFPKDIYVLVSVTQANFAKVSQILMKKLNIKHWRNLSKHEKTIYVEKFLRRWNEIRNIVEKVDIKLNFEDLIISNENIIENSKIIIIDNSLIFQFNKIFSNKKIIKENRAKEFSSLVLLADNIANIVRRCSKNNKRYFFEKIKEFIK